MKTRFQDTDIYFSVSGQGEALVLLHGFLESRKIWEPFIPEFSRYGKILRIDLPGHGESGVIGDTHSMELMAEAVHHVMLKVDIKRANFIGHSMGGYVALAFLEKYPEMVGELMLLNSTPEEDSEEKKKIRDRSVEIVEQSKKAYISMAISNLFTPENNKLFEKEVEKLKEDAYTFPKEGIKAALKGMKLRKDRQEVLKKFSGKKVIVTGKEDPLLDFDSIKIVAEASDCLLFGLSGGHLTYLENKKEFRKLCISSKK